MNKLLETLRGYSSDTREIISWALFLLALVSSAACLYTDLRLGDDPLLQIGRPDQWLVYRPNGFLKFEPPWFLVGGILLLSAGIWFQRLGPVDAAAQHTAAKEQRTSGSSDPIGDAAGRGQGPGDNAEQIEIERIKFLREEIKFEHTQIANRLTALLTSQSFLFMAFALSAIGSRRELAEFRWFSFETLAPLAIVTASLLGLGVVTAFIRLSKVRAMLFEKKVTHPIREELRDRYLPDWSPGKHILSLAYAAVIPLVIVLAWLVILCRGPHYVGNVRTTASDRDLPRTVQVP